MRNITKIIENTEIIDHEAHQANHRKCKTIKKMKKFLDNEEHQEKHRKWKTTENEEHQENHRQCRKSIK